MYQVTAEAVILKTDKMKFKETIIIISSLIIATQRIRLPWRNILVKEASLGHLVPL